MNIIVTGSIAYDYLMRFPGRFTDHLIREQLHQVSLSFLVDDMTKHWGGVAANIAYTLALLGLRPKLMGTVGRDFSDYRLRLESVGVNTSTIRQIDDVFTASFFVNTDLDNNQIASFYTGAMSHARHYSLADVYDGSPDIVVISPNDPEAMMKIADECRQRNIRFMYDPSQQVPRLDGEALRQGMAGAYAMVLNAYEAEMISEKTGYSLDQLRQEVELLVITQGPRGSHIYLNGDLHAVPVFPVDEIKDPTGVGDAYRAGLLAGLAYDWPIDLAGKVGSLCAAYVLEQVGTQNHDFTVTEFAQRFRTHFDDQGLLDMLSSDGGRLDAREA
ncbi:MAG: carbohydrate kinase family protein [Chloroflexi bacterium]|nr:carbohydrate kinase family protein [Chloroflexota bacterium]